MSAHERTGWRCEWISTRHRTAWGFNCPVADLDAIYSTGGAVTGDDSFRAAEFDHERPVALIDYKHIMSNWSKSRKDSSINAQICLANMAGLPFFVALYSPEAFEFEVIPMNSLAVTKCNGLELSKWSEYRFVKFLYQLRGRNVDDYGLYQLQGRPNIELVNEPYDPELGQGQDFQQLVKQFGFFPALEMLKAG